eukprot:26321_1
MFQLRYCKDFNYFVETLGAYIQEKSASNLDKFLLRNKNEWKHEIPNGMVSLGTCTTTMRNKIEMDESPIITLKIMQKWNCDLAENDLQSFRMLLYGFYTLPEDDPLLHVTFDVMEYFLVTMTHISIQDFGCRHLGEDESLLMVSCARSVDYSIYCSFNRLNLFRDKKLNILTTFLINICGLEAPYNEIIAGFVWGGYYKFKFDENEYNQTTGHYKDCEIESEESDLAQPGPV